MPIRIIKRKTLSPALIQLGRALKEDKKKKRPIRVPGQGTIKVGRPPPNLPPTDIMLSDQEVLDQELGAIVGVITVIDPDDDAIGGHQFSLSDNRFEVAIGNVLKLKDTEQLDFETEDTVSIIITAVDSGHNSLAEPFTLIVVQNLTPPDGNAPTNIAIDPLNVPEKVTGAPIGIVTVTDADLPADSFTFQIDDSRFEVVDGILKLKSGEQVLYSLEPTVPVIVTAIDETSLSISMSFNLTVIEQILPDPNHPPTEIQLSATSIDDLVYGDIVGTITVQDEDLPGDTITVTCDDDRFVILDNVLRLKPPFRVSFATEPTVTVTITAHDATNVPGEEISRTFELTVVPAGGADLTNAIFVGPNGLGTQSGNSFANATGWASINSVIGNAAAAGKQVLMASHLGNYTAALRQITNGGAAGTPVQIIGCNAAGEAADAIIVGVRADPWPADGSGPDGAEVFRLLAGANYLSFRNFTFRNCGNGCFRVGDNIVDLTLDTITGDSVTRMLENNVSGAATSASISGLTIRNSTVIGFSRCFARVQYNSSDVLIEDCLGDSLAQQDDGGFPTGIVFAGSAHNITVRRCTMRNNRSILTAADYWNGDGFSSEINCHDFLFEDCRGTGNTDGGFDLKSSNTTLTRCTAADNKRNFRLWTSATLNYCYAFDPNLRGGTGDWEQLWAGTNGIVSAAGCAFCDDYAATQVFNCEAATTQLTVTASSLQMNAAATLLDNPSGASASISTNAAPVCTVLPVITGNPVADQTLESTTGTWPAGATFLYQWLRDGDYIDDGTASTYVTVEADVGLTISCRVFGIVGGAIGEATSLSTTAITALSLTNTAVPVITGPPIENGILGFVAGTWDGIPAPTLTYQWQADAVDLSGQTGTTLTLTAAHVGKAIRVVETATNVSGAVTANSAATAAIGAAGSVTTFWVRPAAHGTGSGFDAANAASMASINSLIAAVGADGIINVVSDDGTYSAANRVLTHGGTAGHPVTIRGRTMANAAAVAAFSGTRFIWTHQGYGTITDPFTTTNGSAVVAVHHVAHGMVAGNRSRLRYRSADDVGGLSLDDHPYTCTIVDADNYTITHHTAATSSATGGGTVTHEYRRPFNVSGQATGAILFELNSGANYLTFDRLSFTRVGNGCFNAKQNISGLTVTNCTYFNVQRFIEQGLNPVSVTGLTVTDCSGIGHSECAIRFRGGSSNLVVTDCDFDSARQSGDSFAMGIQMSELSHDMTFTRVICRNTDGTYDGDGYWNGDGFVGEVSNHNVSYVDCESYGNTDGGYDQKGYNITMTNCIAEDNGRNYRCWGEWVMTDCISNWSYLPTGSNSSRENIYSIGFEHNHLIVIRPVFNDVTGSRKYTTTNDGQLWVRDEDATGIPGGGTTNILGTMVTYNAADVTPCTISNLDDYEIFDGAPFSITLAANESALWEISGGADAAKFERQYHTLSLLFPKQSSAPSDADLDSVYEVEVTAKDAGDQDTTKTISVHVVPPYAQAVTFDGTNDWLTRADDISTQGNVPHLFAAGRIKFLGGDATLQRFMTQAGAVARITREDSNKLSFRVADGSLGTNSFSGVSLSDWVVADGWIDFMLRVQTNFAAGLKVFQLWKRTSGTGAWINDTGTVTDANGSFSIGYATRGDWGFFASNAGSNKFNGDASDFIISLASGPDPALQATRDKWALDDGTWVYPGSAGVTLLGYTARFAFQGPYNVYPYNIRGSGGGTLLHGTLVDSTPPP